MPPDPTLDRSPPYVEGLRLHLRDVHGDLTVGASDAEVRNRHRLDHAPGNHDRLTHDHTDLILDDGLHLFDGTRMQLLARDTAHTSAPRDARSYLEPGLYVSDPQGHALLIGTNRRELAVIDGGPTLIGGVQVEDPDVLDALADRLRFLADRRRDALGRDREPTEMRPVTAPADQAAASVIGVTVTGFGTDTPQRVPTADGGVQLEWHRDGTDVEVYIEPGGETSAWYRGSHLANVLHSALTNAASGVAGKVAAETLRDLLVHIDAPDESEYVPLRLPNPEEAARGAAARLVQEYARKNSIAL